MSQHVELLARYQHLRKVGRQLNSRLAATLSRSVLDEGGKKLGILKRNVLTLDSEDEIAVLMDYCIHDVWRQGANAIERYLTESPPLLDSDEMVLLQAKRQARYSLFAVEAVEPGVGVHVRDLLRDEPLLLVDVSFSRTAPIGMILATRVMTPEGIVQTTGAPLPIAIVPAAQRATFLQSILKMLKEVDFRHLPPEQESELTATIIRSCLQLGAAARIRYAKPGTGSRRRPASARLSPARRAGRNAPCPCGSGKNFKDCCATHS